MFVGIELNLYQGVFKPSSKRLENFVIPYISYCSIVKNLRIMLLHRSFASVSYMLRVPTFSLVTSHRHESLCGRKKINQHQQVE
ncbi:CLUMA_CG005683, isoform A [Clunio marinus]|uniref:CLUMA_CG005683, isoform A n=1 Tax=Clunio marinus TaxID=568069 RepID=A0A1J1HZY0_9DIPT|nr:CLUMA_CG005683, isoform A [Clunio marinus]